MATVARGTVNDHPVVSHEAWLAARAAFRAKETGLTRRRDELSRAGRAERPDGVPMATVARGTVNDHPVVSHDAWLAARTAFLVKEKEFTRLRDELSRERRALPWERVERAYRFDGPGGQETLADL